MKFTAPKHSFIQISSNSFINGSKSNSTRTSIVLNNNDRKQLIHKLVQSMKIGSYKNTVIIIESMPKSINLMPEIKWNQSNLRQFELIEFISATAISLFD